TLHRPSTVAGVPLHRRSRRSGHERHARTQAARDRRTVMKRRVIALAGALILLGVCASLVSFGGDRAKAAPGSRPSPCDNGRSSQFDLESTIAFSSTRDDPTRVPVADAAEIYLMSPDGTNLRRLTDNDAGDGFANLSPDGKKIVFDSDRISGHANITDLFLMN